MQFSRSLRSLSLDGFRATRIALFLGIINMVALLAWFFFAHVTLYESTTDVAAQERGRVLARLRPEAIERVRQGQAAILRLSAGGDQPAFSAPAVVMRRDVQSGTVELVVFADQDLLSNLGRELKGELEIEVEHLTPAELVMRVSGRFLNTGQIPLSPQNLERKD
ncbi:MAG TPA: hypothetical protein VLS48_03990 [Anaerolineales bacterium]|nr:hypothetical protein [Anaerolineales bacterium]